MIGPAGQQGELDRRSRQDVEPDIGPAGEARLARSKVQGCVPIGGDPDLVADGQRGAGGKRLAAPTADQCGTGRFADPVGRSCDEPAAQERGGRHGQDDDPDPKGGRHARGIRLVRGRAWPNAEPGPGQWPGQGLGCQHESRRLAGCSGGQRGLERCADGAARHGARSPGHLEQAPAESLPEGRIGTSLGDLRLAIPRSPSGCGEIGGQGVKCRGIRVGCPIEWNRRRAGDASPGGPSRRPGRGCRGTRRRPSRCRPAGSGGATSRDDAASPSGAAGPGGAASPGGVAGPARASFGVTRHGCSFQARPGAAPVGRAGVEWPGFRPTRPGRCTTPGCSGRRRT